MALRLSEGLGVTRGRPDLRPPLFAEVAPIRGGQPPNLRLLPLDAVEIADILHRKRCASSSLFYAHSLRANACSIRSTTCLYNGRSSSSTESPSASITALANSVIVGGGSCRSLSLCSGSRQKPSSTHSLESRAVTCGGLSIWTASGLVEGWL